jgi:hypothetical protein
MANRVAQTIWKGFLFLKRYGGAFNVTITRKQPGTYNPITDNFSSPGADIVVKSVGTYRRFDEQEQAGGLAQVGHRALMIAGHPLGNFAVSVGDLVTTPDGQFRVQQILLADAARANWEVLICLES